MNSFVGQDGTIQFHYKQYGVREVAPFAVEPRIRPNARISLLAQGEGSVENHRGNWGMGTGRFDWNARDDRLEDSPLWKHLFGKPGCHVVIPASRVYEATTRTGDRRWHAVKRKDGAPMWIPGLGRVQAGKYRTEWHVAMVTVESGEVFRTVHDKDREVAILRGWDEVQEWLRAEDAARLKRLLRNAGGDVVEAYRVSDDVLKPAFPAEKCAEAWAPA